MCAMPRTGGRCDPAEDQIRAARGLGTRLAPSTPAGKCASTKVGMRSTHARVKDIDDGVRTCCCAIVVPPILTRTRINAIEPPYRTVLDSAGGAQPESAITLDRRRWYSFIDGIKADEAIGLDALNKRIAQNLQGREAYNLG